jgi:hypothetical protein
MPEEHTNKQLSISVNNNNLLAKIETSIRITNRIVEQRFPLINFDKWWAIKPTESSEDYIRNQNLHITKSNLIVLSTYRKRLSDGFWDVTFVNVPQFYVLITFIDAEIGNVIKQERLNDLKEEILFSGLTENKCHETLIVITKSAIYEIELKSLSIDKLFSFHKEPTSIGMNESEKKFFIGYADGSIEIIDGNTAKTMGINHLSEIGIKYITFSRTKNTLLMIDQNNRAHIYRFDEKVKLSKINEHILGNINRPVSKNKDESEFIVCSSSNIYQIAAEDGCLKCTGFNMEPYDEIVAITHIREEFYLAGSYKGNMLLIDTISGKIIKEVPSFTGDWDYEIDDGPTYDSICSVGSYKDKFLIFTYFSNLISFH